MHFLDEMSLGLHLMNLNTEPGIAEPGFQIWNLLNALIFFLGIIKIIQLLKLEKSL